MFCVGTVHQTLHNFVIYHSTIVSIVATRVLHSCSHVSSIRLQKQKECTCMQHFACCANTLSFVLLFNTILISIFLGVPNFLFTFNALNTHSALSVLHFLGMNLCMCFMTS